MNKIEQTFSNPGLLLMPIMAILVIVALLLIIKVIASRYVKTGPDEIAIFSGRKYRSKGADGTVQTRGFLILQGGGRVLMPIVEKVTIMNISAFQVEVSEQGVPNKDSVKVTVKGIATCKISTAEEDLANAATNFIGKKEEERKQFIANILKGHVRSIVGNLDIAALLREREKLNQTVISESTAELKRIGIEMINLVIQDVHDELGYIDSLGRRQVADALRDAQIAVADAERETSVRTSDAKRTAAEATAKNDALVQEAQKDRDVKVAAFKQEVAARQAEAEMAGPIARAAQEQTLKVAEAERDGATAKAQTEVQKLEATRKEQELQATVIVPAEAEAKAVVIRATGVQNAQKIEAEMRRNVAALNAETAKKTAEGVRDAAILEGEGEGKKRQSIAEGEAVATEKTMKAKATGEEALLVAQATGTKASKLADAEGKLKMLLAEAEGTEKMAEALKKLNEQGKLIMILDRLPQLIEVGGDAGKKIADSIFANLGKSVERIGPINITDLGGGTTAKNGIAAVGDIIPDMISNLFAKLKLRGVDGEKFLSMIGLDATQLASMLATPAAAAAAPGETPAPASGAPDEKKS